MLGKLLVYLVFLLSLSSSVLYFLSYRKKVEWLVIARKMFFGVITGVLLISFLLLLNILNHNFQMTYIWENSSTQLSSMLLVASFYAGQQGSFLLWVTFFAVVGIFLVNYTKKTNYEALVMGFYVMVMMFLLMLIMIKTPFELAWETFKGQIAVGFQAVEGRGLNPILENFWMVIHPPVLFVGYTAVAIPFVFAITALIQKDYRNWVNIAFPWVLFSSAILGLGIMLGGFWAYETLGWGGFWGWDPVENSSLMPWLTSMALVHTMIIQRKTGALPKTNFVLAIVSFILVLYATFLTRSGVLGSTSVHSFTDPGSTIYFVLIIILILFIALSAYTFAIRAKGITGTKINMSLSSREFMLSLGSILILITSAIVFFGTSWPIISELFGMTKTSVQTSFYNNTNLPVVVLILISNAICLYMSWKKNQSAGLFKRSLISFIISIIITIIFITTGITQLTSILLLFSIIYSFVVNGEFALKNLVKNPLSLGGYISHIGISVLMVGVLVLGIKSSSSIFTVKQGEVKNINGYNIKFVNKTGIDKHRKDMQKFQYNLNIDKGGSSDIVGPIVYWSDFNQRRSPIFEPGIKSYLTEDIYLVLKASNYDNELKSIELKKGETGACLLDTTIAITLNKFEIDHKMLREGKSPSMGAVVDYSVKGKISADTVFTKMKTENDMKDLSWKKIPGSDYDISFSYFIPAQDSASQAIAIMAFKKSSEPYKEPLEILTVEAQFKPFISFVWAGVLIIVIGFIISYIRNRKEKLEAV